MPLATVSQRPRRARRAVPFIIILAAGVAILTAFAAVPAAMGRPLPGSALGGPAAAGVAPPDQAVSLSPNGAAPVSVDLGAGNGGDVEALLGAMTLEEKVGQLFMVHAYGAMVADPDPAMVEQNRQLHGVDNWRELLETYPVGGVVFFLWANNIMDPWQVAALVNELQQVALNGRVPVPLLVALDQEGGLVQRITEPATELPGNMALAAAGDPELAYRAAFVTGLELKAMGVNVNFAPVADVNVNADNPVIGVRSFGDRADVVAQYVAAQVRGYRDAGIAATAKHFPGHGDTDVDSHTGLPLIAHDRAEVDNIDLPPFQAAVDAGVDLIMTAHIVVPALDPSRWPATMSRPILTELLRETLGFDGVIVTDALTMEGARQTFDPARVAVEALLAGADMLLMPPDLGAAYRAVLDAVHRGELSEDRVDRSVRRILELKRRLGLFTRAQVDPARVGDVVGAPEHKAVASEIAARSITLVRNAAGLLPLDIEGLGSVLVTGWGQATTAGLAAALAAAAGSGGLDVRVITTGAAPDPAAIRLAVDAAQAVDLVIVVTQDAHLRPAQQTLVHGLLATGKPVVVVGVGTPYDVGVFPTAGTYVAIYGYRPVSLRALAEVLLGQAPPRGRLPVDVPLPERPGVLLYPAGHGLTY